MSEPVRECQEMLRQMQPVLDPERYVYVRLDAPCPLPPALAVFREEEGLSAVLPTKAAAGLRPHGPVLRRITLSVHSALDGVGLTAAVAGVLAGAGIACNVIAALHHDHILVPEADAERALAALLALQAAQG